MVGRWTQVAWSLLTMLMSVRRQKGGCVDGYVFGLREGGMDEWVSGWIDRWTDRWVGGSVGRENLCRNSKSPCLL